MLEKEQITIILQSIKSLEERFARLSVSEKIPQIEIDLSLSKIQYLYEEVINLDKLIKTKVVIENSVLSKKTTTEQQIDVSNKISETKQKKEINELEKKSENQVVPTNPIPDKEESIVVHKTEIFDPKTETVTANIKQQIIIPEVEEKAAVSSSTKENETIKKEKKEQTENSLAENFSMNDLLAKNISGSNIANKLKNKPIKSINEAIGLNDKFLFIRELFNGKADDFSKTVEIFNQIDNFQQCIEYVQSNFQWDFDDANVIKFLEIVNRRFIQ